MDDVRYSELLFLRAVATGKVEYFNVSDHMLQKAVGLQGEMFIEMGVAALEDLSIRIDNLVPQQLVGRLRGEIGGPCPSNIPDYHWNDPRYGLYTLLNGQPLQRIRITFRGFQRIEELRNLLRQ